MKILAILLALGVSAFAQATSGSVVAGSTADTFHSPTQVCTFLGATATNPPCVTTYNSDAGTLFYGYAGLPFSFAIPVPNGSKCDVTVHAFEPNKTAAGQRVFNVVVANNSVLVDIFAAVGLNMPYTLILPNVPVTDNLLHVSFQPKIGNAVVGNKKDAPSIEWTCTPVPPPGLTNTIVCPNGVSLTLNNGIVTQAQCNPPCGDVALCTFVYHEIPLGQVDGTNRIFTIKTVPYPNSVQVWIGNQMLTPGTDYTVSGATITLVTAPALVVPTVDYRA